ncbi:hypothetical protein VSH64_10405 [Amycolatopsis rhabdoformis]|uniref:Lipoprotein n=1 Tax=Amycolatopsis rhabdoformis TaxID=1448059 RepID=A0ABZ1IGF2_9PSEU|nr:hypothetical protein [Amycolatopsis rhabdoformis]WSE32515.1 hypothetical protein VSH64_10405 [Amycolatopsis rhabdoformis]
MTLRPLLVRTALHGCALLTATLALAACGGAPSTDTAPGVAALPGSTAPASPSATTSVDDARPLIRPDTDGAETQRLIEAWTKCLTDHGIPDVKREHDHPLPQYRPAHEACAAKEPEFLQDRLKRTDPGSYQDGMRALVACLKAHGVEVKDTPGFQNGYELDPHGSMPIAQQMNIDAQCQQEAFGGR